MLEDLVIIDPGHGGSDPGAVSPANPGAGDSFYTEEDDINLAVSLKVKEHLSRVMRVALTREVDKEFDRNVNTDLYKRVAYANSLGGKLFVSIHCNSAADRSANGVETFCYAFGGNGEKLARAVHARLVPATGFRDRGVKEANFYVLRKTTAPAILIELGFVSNIENESKFNNEEWQNTVALAITEGICDFMGVTLPAPVKEEITVIKPTKVVFDGKELKAFMLSDNRNYVQVRELAEMLGLNVAWDEATETVTLTRK